MKLWQGTLLAALTASCRTLLHRSDAELLTLSAAARCYEFDARNRDYEDFWRWLVLDTATVGAQHGDERSARRLALEIGAFNHSLPDRRTEWVRTKDDSIAVLVWGMVPGYTLAETHDGLVGSGWLASDVVVIEIGPDGTRKQPLPTWPTHLRRTPCGEVPRFQERPR